MAKSSGTSLIFSENASQELKALEENKIITRTLHDSMPVAVEYSPDTTRPFPAKAFS
ncbi:MAG: hypothetical protein WDN75_06690 [Bacteroidota bacterium]